MQTYFYRAKTATAADTEGTLQAQSRQAALDSLEGQGLFPLEITESAPTRAQASRWFGRVGRKEITGFTRQLADLLRAGINLDGAFEILIREVDRPQMRELLGELRGAVSSGEALSDALARRPELFDPLMVNMVRAGEEGGFLADVLDRVATFAEKRDALAGKVKEAMVYPAILTLLGGATVIYLLTFFIPRFSQMFADLGATLPRPTLFLLAISGFLAAYWPILLLVIAGGALALIRGLETEAAQLLRDRLALRLPLVRAVANQAALARFARTFGTLLASGVPVLRCLEISGKATGNRVYQAHVERIADEVKDGAKIGDAMSLESLFPPSFRGRVGVGEESGTLEPVLLRMADGYEIAVDRAVKAFVTAFEPLMICILAGVVGFIVISMLLPIFTLSKAIKAN